VKKAAEASKGDFELDLLELKELDRRQNRFSSISRLRGAINKKVIPNIREDDEFQ